MLRAGAELPILINLGVVVLQRSNARRAALLIEIDLRE
jgi:hypothetical protein